MFKTLLIAFLLPIAVTAHQGKGKYTENKKINKEFTVNKDANLSISNKYGNINVISGNTNKIEIEVSITVNGNNEEKVAQRLEEITVDFTNSASNVSAKTSIGKSSNSWSYWGKKNSMNFEINYMVKMPVTNSVNLSNDYGSINLDKLEGSAKIDCDYGKIIIGELLNDSNSINIDYTNKSRIDFMKKGSVNADYSNLHIEKSNIVSLNADYSNISFGMIGDLSFNCDYGDLKMDNVNNISGNCDYMDTKIGKLFESGVFDIDYGSLKIGALGEGFEKLSVDSGYTQINIGVNATNAFDIEADLSYANLRNIEGFNFSKEIKKTSSKYYLGYYNKANSNSQINIKSKYGNVTFTNN